MYISSFSLSQSTDPLPVRCFQKAHHRKTRWRILGVIALGAMMIANAKAEEKFDVDWSTWGSSSEPQKSNPESRIAFVSAKGSLVVGPGTEPTNPFPDSEFSLYVTSKNPADTWFRLVARPFVDESPIQGALELEFQLVEGTMALSLGHSDQAWIPENLPTYYITETINMISFTVDKEVVIRGKAYQTAAITTLESGKNYRLVVKWDLSTTEQFSFFLNGEPLTLLTGTPAPTTPSETGINAFRITLGSAQDHLGAFFLGRLSGRSGPVDLYSPEGLIGK